MKCNKCGYDLKEEQEYCPNCGTKVEKKHGIECCHCHYVMSEECNFCPSCGKEVVKDSDGCKYCGYSLTSEDSFCPNCGKETGSNVSKVEVPKEDIVEEVSTAVDETKTIEEPNENQVSMNPNETATIEKTGGDNAVEPIREDVTKAGGGYTPIGKTTSNYVKETPNKYVSSHTSDTIEKPLQTKVTEKKNDAAFWRNPILWIISISLLIICLLLSQYMKDNPSSSSKKDSKIEQKVVEEELDDIKITKDTSTFVMQTNNNSGGASYQFDDKLYLSVDGYIYEMNLDFSDAKKVVDESGEYIYVDKQYIYYCDEEYNYQRVDRKSDKKETILENAYYARMIDGMLYYQSDTDGETIHVYNLETKEDRKINNEKSYAMAVDTKNNVIYYTNGDNALCKINIDGTGNEVLLGDYSIIDFIYEEGFIYYVDEFGINTFDLATKTDEMLLEEESIMRISLLEDKIVYSGYDVGLYVINKDGSGKKTITTNHIQGMEVQGDVVIYKDASKETVYGATKDAKRSRIHKIENSDSYDQEDSPDIDGIQEF